VAQQEKFLEEMRATLGFSKEQKRAAAIELNKMVEDLTPALAEIERLTQYGRTRAYA
jgi:hypothetical protein